MDKLLLRIEELEKSVHEKLLEKYIKNLRENGYVVITGVLNLDEVNEAKEMFYNWKNSIPEFEKFHNTVNPHGIFKFHQVGHQEFAWFIRTRPQIINIFKKIWETDELVVSFDGSCYISKDLKKKDKIWTHTDQASNNSELTCFQSFVSLTDNSERTLIVYEKSHLLHREYFVRKGECNSKNWNLIDIEYLDKISHLKRKLTVKKGDLVIWDSRTFHQNQYGLAESEERIVQYICYLPKNNNKNTKTMQKKREKYFLEKRTTSHWPYPINVNSLQPQTYGDSSKLIDYSKLKDPKLDIYMETIKKLI